MATTLTPPARTRDVIAEPLVEEPVVQAPAAQESISTEIIDAETQPDYLAIYRSSILAVTIIFLIGVGWPCSIYLDDYVSGFGLGAMTAVWGGPSFGVIAGSARVAAWFEANEGH